MNIRAPAGSQADGNIWSILIAEVEEIDVLVPCCGVWNMLVVVYSGNKSPHTIKMREEVVPRFVVQPKRDVRRHLAIKVGIMVRRSFLQLNKDLALHVKSENGSLLDEAQSLSVIHNPWF